MSKLLDHARSGGKSLYASNSPSPLKLVHVAYQDESNGHVYTRYHAEEVRAPGADEGWLETLTPLFTVNDVRDL